MSFEVETLSPRPAPRQWATAMTSYVQATGPEFGMVSGAKRWLNGITFKPYGCDKIIGATLGDGTGDINVCGDDRLTEYLTKDPAVTFHPFVAEVAVESPLLCDTLEELLLWVAAHSEVERSSILAGQVETAAYQTSNDSLASTATDVSGGDSSLMGALYYIEEGLADRLDGGAGMIHMTPGAFVLAAAGGGVRYDGDGRPMTQTGHFIIADAGYQGASPYAQAPVANELWIYGSGPVVAFMDPEVSIEGGFDAFQYRTNEWKVDAEQYGIAFFDPCSVVAAVVGLGDDSILAGPVGS